MSKQIKDLNDLVFDNKFVRVLPKDPEEDNFSRQVFGSAFSLVSPEIASNPYLIAYSKEVADSLDISEEILNGSHLKDVFSGNQPLKKMQPYATCYGGHQFGHWAGQLGDGRAINLGEVINSKGQRLALQLKGAGPTPYSRSADGYAVMRSSVREFLCSEAMHHLGVPTTRAFSLIGTGDQVVRDMFYDGHPKEEPGAVVCRVAPSFTRFGHFELPASRGEIELLKAIADYTIETDFPHIGKNQYLDFFREVTLRTAELMVHWMRVGFVHGVMNTDNMSILGLTIDYGPYGWLENYDPMWTPNTTDAQGRRYCFGNQPMVAKWNLVQLANGLYPLIEAVEPLKEILDEYSLHFDNKYKQMMANKLGLGNFVEKLDMPLIDKLPELLQLAEIDMTIFFRQLAELSFDDKNITKEKVALVMSVAFYQPEKCVDDILEKIHDWVLGYQKSFEIKNLSDVDRKTEMNSHNPLYVLRNYLAQEAIQLAEKGDGSKVYELLDVLRNPYQLQSGKEHFAGKRPEWARHKPGCSTLSCSS